MSLLEPSLCLSLWNNYLLFLMWKVQLPFQTRLVSKASFLYKWRCWHKFIFHANVKHAFIAKASRINEKSENQSRDEQLGIFQFSRCIQCRQSSFSSSFNMTLSPLFGANRSCGKSSSVQSFWTEAPLYPSQHFSFPLFNLFSLLCAYVGLPVG